MKSSARQARGLWFALAISLFLSAAATDCVKQEQPARKIAPTPFETMRGLIQARLFNAPIDSMMISARALKEQIVDDWSNRSGRYEIVSVRTPRDYEQAGHIPHAINIEWIDIAADENLARLDRGKQLILYCYYGNTSMISRTILSLLGYDCRCLDFGMMDWNLKALVKKPWAGTAGYPVETITRSATETFPAPVLASAETDSVELIKEAARRYLAGGDSPIIRAEDVKPMIDSWEEEKAEYQIVDVRSFGDYTSGHVPYAINIPLANIAQTGNLAKLNPDKTVITYSENGQTGQMAAMVLNLLGYRSVNLLFGMMEWNAAYVDSTYLWAGAADYPIVLDK